MLYVSPAVHENIEDKKHYLRLCTGILNGIKAGVAALIEWCTFAAPARLSVTAVTDRALEHSRHSICHHCSGGRK